MMRNLWKGFVLEVINECLIIILKDVFQVLECCGGLYQETNGLQLDRTTDGVDISREADLANSLAIVPVENSFCSDTLVDQEKSATDEFISTLDVDGLDVNILTFGDHRVGVSRNFFVWEFVQSVVGLWVFI